MNEANKDIQTLLLCKINAHSVRTNTDSKHDKQDAYRKIYQSIYCGEGGDFGRRYITMGNFDAVSIYQTKKQPGDQWLDSVYQDHMRIYRHIKTQVNYLPIHLLSNNPDVSREFWKQSKNYPVCVMSLVYGVREHVAANVEQELADVIRNKADNQTGCFMVYQAINICDAVVIWFTENINDALYQASNLSWGGHARKTYTLVGFRMVDGGLCNLDTIKSDHRGFHLRIQGSIRDHSEIQRLFLNKKKTLLKRWIFTSKACATDSENIPSSKSSTFKNYVFGRDDFTVTVHDLNKEELKSVLKGLMQYSAEISNACWEIHTEFVLPGHYDGRIADY